jgi:hypothetical protein
MILTKTKARSQETNGYEYAGYWDGFYRYSKRERGVCGVAVINTTYEDVTGQNARWMMLNGFSRVELKK